MSISRMVTVICDECIQGADGSGWTVAEARETARLLGWSLGRKRDLCPECVAKVAA